MAKEQDEKMEALKKIEKEEMAKRLDTRLRDGEFEFKDYSPHSSIWDELRKLLDELAGLRVEKWIANHSKEKSS
jgi:hypothetical protein